MTRFERSLDEQIRKAIREGAFDNLPGKGKPLNLEDNPYEDPAWRTAFRMLRSGGHTLPWIEKRQTIEADLQAARDALERTWVWRHSTGIQGILAQVVEEEWQRALARFREVVVEINERIFNYNLEVPADPFKRPLIQVDREIHKITLERDLPSQPD